MVLLWMLGHRRRQGGRLALPPTPATGTGRPFLPPSPANPASPDAVTGWPVHSHCLPQDHSGTALGRGRTRRDAPAGATEPIMPRQAVETIPLHPGQLKDCTGSQGKFDWQSMPTLRSSRTCSWTEPTVLLRAYPPPYVRAFRVTHGPLFSPTLSILSIQRTRSVVCCAVKISERP